MNAAPHPVRIGDLVGSTVVTAAGKRVGRVADVVVTRSPPYLVTALDLGAGGWLDRMGVGQVLGIGGTPKRESHRIRWADVDTFDGRTVMLKPGWNGAQRSSMPSADEPG